MPYLLEKFYSEVTSVPFLVPAAKQFFLFVPRVNFSDLARTCRSIFAYNHTNIHTKPSSSSLPNVHSAHH